MDRDQVEALAKVAKIVAGAPADATDEDFAAVKFGTLRPLIALKSTPAISEWRDIATAPKDGTRILLGGGRMFCERLGHWVTESLSAQWDGDFWLVGGSESGYVCLGIDDPTHWMPLPAPPQPESAK